jgi:hypothetical protein
MFGLFQKRKQKKTRSIPVNRLRLVLETLEQRDCPSGSDLSSLLAIPDSSSVVVQAQGDGAPTNQAPSITLNIAYGSQRMVTLSGQVTDENPGGLTVTFTGAVEGSVVTNPDGTFSIELEASALGTVEATTIDGGGLWSNTATAEVVSDPPMITDMTRTQSNGNVFTFSGRVIDESAAGMTIHFAGLVSVEGRTVTVEADGTFCFVVQLQPNEEGTVTAVTYDWWGQISNTVEYTVRQS